VAFYQQKKKLTSILVKASIGDQAPFKIYVSCDRGALFINEQRKKLFKDGRMVVLSNVAFYHSKQN
jgi:hypothetical protein